MKDVTKRWLKAKLAVMTGLIAVTVVMNFAIARAAVIPNSLFTDNVVLQQGMEVPIWGTAGDGESVTVQFASQKVSTITKNGKWMVRLKSLKAGGPFTMTIAGENTVTLTNVLVGEVWICSGQSNMERQLGPRPPQQPIDNWEQEVASANYPEIREFDVNRVVAENGVMDARGKWVICSPQTVSNFTAVGYFFGRDLHQALKVPIGLIHSSWGGTPAESWTGRPALENQAELRKWVESYDKAKAAYPAKLAEYQKYEPELMEKYNAKVEQAKQDGKPAPRKPAPPTDPAKNPLSPTVLYNGMIVPLQPMAFRGVIWYQGESNSGRGKEYRTLFPTMIADWRNAWSKGDSSSVSAQEFPFLFVQIAPFRSNTPDVREAQLLTFQHTPRTAVVVTTDVGDANDIHPPHKQAVGARLALAARAVAYGEKIEYSGPVYESLKVKDDRATLAFTHIGGGLVAKDGGLKGFTIAGTDTNFVSAEAEIKGDTVVVWSEQVSKPIAVRYGWANSPDVNLFNQEGLPASPFCTDAE